MKRIFIFGVFILLALSLSYASIGVSVAPASGNYNFTLDGGTLNLTIFNTGSNNANYITNVTTLSEMVSVDEPLIEIDANSYKTVSLFLDPTKDIEKNKAYELTVEIFSKPPEGIQVSPKVKTTYTITFTGERTLPWAEKKSVEIPLGSSYEPEHVNSTGISVESPLVIGLRANLLLISLASLAIVILAIFIFKKVKHDSYSSI